MEAWGAQTALAGDWCQGMPSRMGVAAAAAAAMGVIGVRVGGTLAQHMGVRVTLDWRCIRDIKVAKGVQQHQQLLLLSRPPPLPLSTCAARVVEMGAGKAPVALQCSISISSTQLQPLSLCHPLTLLFPSHSP